MACSSVCSIVDWIVEELTSFTISESGWEEVVGPQNGPWTTVRHDPPGPITLNEAEVLRRIEGFLELEYGLTPVEEGCGGGDACRCEPVGKPVVVLRGVVEDRFDSVVMTSDARIRYTVTIHFKAVVAKRRAPGECRPRRMPFRAIEAGGRR